MSETQKPEAAREPHDEPTPSEASVESPADAPSRPALGGEMTVLEHLEELRWRIVKAASAVAFAAVVVFIFNHPIIQVLERPLNPANNLLGPGQAQVVKLIFTSPGEYFFAVIKVSLLGGLYLALPVILHQILAFVSPGLLPNERKWAVPIVVGSFVFFTVGMIFSYFLLLPAGLQFLVGFAPAEVEAMLSVGKYLGFAAGLMFGTGVAF